MFRLFSLMIGYGIGLIQTAYFVGKIMGKIDIREHGSGNAGTTNTIRVLGLGAGSIVFICDVIKGIIGFMVCTLLFKGGGTFMPPSPLGPLPGLYGGIGVILGHSFPFYLKFKGGKGVASALGIILCIDFPVALILYIMGAIIVAVTRYISAASLAITLFLPVGLAIAGYSAEVVVLAAVIAAFIWYLHRANIKRLIKGNENKFNFKKQV